MKASKVVKGGLLTTAGIEERRTELGEPPSTEPENNFRAYLAFIHRVRSSLQTQKKKEALKAKDSIEIHRVITDEYKKETCKTSKIVFELNEGDTKVLYTDGYDVPYRMVHITSGKYNKYFQLKNRPALTTIQAHSSGDMPYLAAVGLIGRHSGGTWTMYKALTAVFPSEFISCIGKQGHSIR